VDDDATNAGARSADDSCRSGSDRGLANIEDWKTTYTPPSPGARLLPVIYLYVYMQIWLFLWLFPRLFFFSWVTFPFVRNSRPFVAAVCYGMSTPAARALAAGSQASSGDERGCRLAAVEAGHLRHWLPLIFQC